MNRRSYMKTMAAAVAPAAAASPIQLHVDLEVDPAREKELAATFKNVFRPAIRKQPGFVEVRLLKLRQVLGGPPAHAPYRLLIAFASEEQRKQWVASDDHQRVWPRMEQTLRGGKYTAVLFDAEP